MPKAFSILARRYCSSSVLKARSRQYGSGISGRSGTSIITSRFMIFVVRKMISDMQTMDGTYGRGVADLLPADVALYGVNRGGYRATPIPACDKLRVELPALSDKVFSMIPMLEAGVRAVFDTLPV